MVLVLRNKHYKALLPPKDNKTIPKPWLRESHEQFAYIGGAEDACFTPNAKRQRFETASAPRWGRSTPASSLRWGPATPSSRASCRWREATPVAPASGSRKASAGKASDKKTSEVKNGGECQWACPHCSMIVEAPTKKKLYNRKFKHLRSRHKEENQKNPARLKPKSFPVKPFDVPVAERHWSCPFCPQHKQVHLPACDSKYQLGLSVRHHYATVHKKRNITKKVLWSAYSKRYQKGLLPRFAEGLKRKPFEMKQATQAKRNPKIGGHDLVHINIDLATWPSLVKRKVSKQQPQRIHRDRVTCKQCFGSPDGQNA